MRIIGGTYRSRTLNAPKGMTTRPTLDQTREALFNILQGRVADAWFLDLYAGSGAVALEAVSRGAARGVLCDQSRAACACIRENIARLGCGEQARLLEMPDARAVVLLSREKAQFDLIYLDPPYAMALTPVLQSLRDAGLLAEGGMVIAEHDAGSEIVPPPGWGLIRRKGYRDTALSFYGPVEEENA